MKNSVAQLLTKSIQTLLVSAIVTQFSYTPLLAATAPVADPAERLDNQINVPASVKLADEAMALESRGDLEGALAKLKQAMRIAPPVAVLYHERALILMKLKRYDEALPCLNFAVELTKNDPKALYDSLADRAVVHDLLLHNVEALADALAAQKLTPKDANPKRVGWVKRVLADTNPLGVIWKRTENVHTPQGDLAEILVLQADGKIVLHHQKIRPDGIFPEMGIPSQAWNGDVGTLFGTGTVANGRLKMTFNVPGNPVIDAIYYLGDEAQTLTLRNGDEFTTYSRGATLVDSIDNI